MGALLLLAVLVSACSAGVRKELPVPYELTIMASERLNPAESGRPSPVVVKVFELADRGFFRSADIFTLLGDAGGTSHAEVIDVQGFSMMPGEIRVVRRMASLGARYVGVVAGYRDIEHSVWRELAPLPPPHYAGRLWSAGVSPEHKFEVLVGERQVTIKDSSR